MRTSINSRSWRRVVAGVAVAALPLGIVATTGGAATAHEAPGSPVEVVINTSASGATTDAIAHGWWGHEGTTNAATGVGTPDNGTGTNTSFLDLNLADPDLAATFPDLSKVGVAFVTTSADGSAEHPAVSGTKSVDQVFPWFMDAGAETGLNGTSAANDSVAVVSTGSEYDAWFAAGKPLQGFNSSLQLQDVSAPGQPVSATPKGKSILNRWASAQHISLVFYQTTGANVNGKPVVAVDGSGHAITAYMPFDTVQKPGDSLRTSAGYIDDTYGAVAQDTTTTLGTSVASPQPANTPIDLTATVAPASGSDVPVGSVEFFDGATSLGTGAVNGSGVAHLNGQVLAVGSHSLKAVYTATNTSSLAFNGSTSTTSTFVINGISTSTAAAATPGSDVTAPVSLTATVTPAGVTGSVVFKDGAATIAGPVTLDGTGLATATHTFNTPGAHTVTAVFTPDAGSSNYSGSQGQITFTLAPPSGVSVDTQSIQATIPTGTITVTTPYTPANPLDLGTLALTPALDGYKGSAQFNDIHVIDTRDGALPWALTAIAGNLGDGAGHFINGENLGLTNLLPEAANNPGTGIITTHDNPIPAVPLAPSDSGSAGLGGVPHTVFSANQGPSDVLYSGTLTLFAPTTTVSGLYTGTITFTAS
ncbi:MAG: Ig-like domain repeat protein [Marmoricola sp.]